MKDFSRFTAPHSPEHVHNTPDKALEIALHDGLDRLQDFTLMMAMGSPGECFEILSITAPEAESATPPQPARQCSAAENVVALSDALLKESA